MSYSGSRLTQNRLPDDFGRARSASCNTSSGLHSTNQVPRHHIGQMLNLQRCNVQPLLACRLDSKRTFGHCKSDTFLELV